MQSQENNRRDYGAVFVVLLQLAAAAAFVVGFLGYPAVIVHFWRLGIPLEFLSNQQAIRAGIGPTVALVLRHACYDVSELPHPNPDASGDFILSSVATGES